MQYLLDNDVASSGLDLTFSEEVYNYNYIHNYIIIISEEERAAARARIETPRLISSLIYVAVVLQVVEGRK